MKRRDIGFLPNLLGYKLKDLFYPEGLVACIVGGAGSVYVHHVTSCSERTMIVADTISVIGIFLGATLVIFALFIMFSDKYWYTIIDSGVHMSVFMRPFIVAMGIQASTLLLSVTYRSVGTHVSGALEHIMFVIWAFLFVYVVADLVAMGRNLFAHGLTREKMLEIENIKQKIEN